ncbi:MAG TPA: class I SAM-dependent methyltransferase [Gemmatimonadaceae bacterium]|nr:class I SAM-dependent methyltransferase [Gemmatimonadaceae bacterium]
MTGIASAPEAGTIDLFERELIHEPVERDRYHNLKRVLGDWRDLFNGVDVLDFGSSSGLSISCLLHNGAKSVVGVEPELPRVERGLGILERTGMRTRATLAHIPDTSKLGYVDGAFKFVLANAVFEHIPQPRHVYLRELWRVVAPGGHLMVNETPNKYIPLEMHTTGLWFNHWLPRDVAHRRAVRNRRFDAERKDWHSSGWRGIGYYELVESLTNHELIERPSRMRHRALSFLGLPGQIIDPWPIWVFRKNG